MSVRIASPPSPHVKTRWGRDRQKSRDICWDLGWNSQEWQKKMTCWFLAPSVFCFWSKHWASKFNHSFCYIDFTWFHWQVCIVMMILQRGLDVLNILVIWNWVYPQYMAMIFIEMINHGILVNQWLYLVVKLLVWNPGTSQDCYIFDNEVPAQFQTTGPNHQLRIRWNLSYIHLLERSPPNPNGLWSTIGWNTFC